MMNSLLQEKYDVHSYSNIYKVQIETESNTIFQTINNSEYSYLYYQSIQLSENLAICKNRNPYPKLFHEILRMDKAVREKNGVCLWSYRF